MMREKPTTLVRIPEQDAGWTFRDGGPSTESEPRATIADALARYSTETTLGEGGMGIVHLVFDRRIGREIAMKTLRSERNARTDFHNRFLREACVQGQLEHPSIVPVYDLGIDAARVPYFTMKRVHGATLEQIIAEMREAGAEATQQYGRRRLLTAFASACQAVAFAHSRGVVHRDLKPSNVMLGDFGEVYVLDWGIAKVVGARDVDGARPVAPPPETETTTLAGVTMGTIGYMAPEQMRGDVEVDARADVYALGAILFELLCLERLHAAPTLVATIASTQSPVDARPSRLDPDVPPELDEICVKAVALDRDDRFESVREMVDALERFLDGDRDVVRRRELAEEHARVSVVAATRAIETEDARDRSAALREAARALALDPRNSAASETLVRLLTRPPREMPAEVRAALLMEARAMEKATAKGALFGYLAWFAFVPFGFWMGVRSERTAVIASIVWALAAVLAYVAMRRASSGWRASGLVATAAAASVTCVVCGPYVLVPTLAVINVIVWLLVSGKRWRAFIITLGALTILVPAALDWAHVARFYNFRDGRVTILQGMLDFHPVATHALLLAASLGLVAVAAVLITRLRDTLDDAERRLHVQAWQLQQLLPPRER